MATIFTKILNGEMPCYKILENDHFLAFLDIKPVKTGHALVIPKKEVDYIFDLSDSELSELMIFSKKVAKLIKQGINCQKIGVMICGLEVPHTHVHLIPINEIDDLNFKNAKTVTGEELSEIAKLIRSNIK